MYTTFTIFEKILSILAQNPEKHFTFEDICNFVAPYFAKSFQEGLSIDIMNQAQVLEALIIMDSEGLIILDSDSDKSIIDLKGLINITTTRFLN